MHISNDQTFRNAERFDGLSIERVLDLGYVLRMEIRDGKAFYQAHDGNGHPRVTFFARLHPNDRCFICVCDDELKTCKCVEVDCKDVK